MTSRRPKPPKIERQELARFDNSDRTASDRLALVEAELTELQGVVFNLIGEAMAKAYAPPPRKPRKRSK